MPMNKPGKPINFGKPSPRSKPGTGIKKPLPVKPGKKPVRPGDKLNPLPTVGNKASKDKKLKTLQLNIDKANKAKAPKMMPVRPKPKAPRNTKRGM
jgi:hypothetical protein